MRNKKKRARQKAGSPLGCKYSVACLDDADLSDSRLLGRRIFHYALNYGRLGVCSGEYYGNADADKAPAEKAPAFAPMTGVTSSGGVDSAAAPRRGGKSAVVKGGFYVVRPGDFPQKIARKCGVRLSDLMAANNLTAETAKRIRVGQKLVVPTGKVAVKKAAKGKSAGSSAPAVEVKDGVYVVRPGDFPQKIARKLKVKLSDLMKLNNLTPEKAARLQVGQKLLVPGATGAAVTVAPAEVTAAPAETPVETAPADVTAAPAEKAPVAAADDTLAATIDAAKSANVTAPAAGNEIMVESDSSPVMADADISVADFAAKNNTTVEKIRQMNPDFSGDIIKKDMVIFVPGKRN